MGLEPTALYGVRSRPHSGAGGGLQIIEVLGSSVFEATEYNRDYKRSLRNSMQGNSQGATTEVLRKEQWHSEW